MSVLRGRDGTAYSVATTTAMTSEATTETAQVYQINNVAKRIWNPNVPIIVTCAFGVDATWGLRGFDYFAGRARMIGGGVSAYFSGEYVSTLAVVADIFQWSINVARGIAEVTKLGDTWCDVTPLGLQATVTISRYRTDTAFDHLASTPWVMFKLEESSGAGFWVLANRTSLGWTKAVGAVDQEALTFEAVGPVSRY